MAREAGGKMRPVDDVRPSLRFEADSRVMPEFGDRGCSVKLGLAWRMVSGGRTAFWSRGGKAKGAFDAVAKLAEDFSGTSSGFLRDE